MLVVYPVDYRLDSNFIRTGVVAHLESLSRWPVVFLKHIRDSIFSILSLFFFQSDSWWFSARWVIWDFVCENAESAFIRFRLYHRFEETKSSCVVKVGATINLTHTPFLFIHPPPNPPPFRVPVTWMTPGSCGPTPHLLPVICASTPEEDRLSICAMSFSTKRGCVVCAGMRVWVCCVWVWVCCVCVCLQPWDKDYT